MVLSTKEDILIEFHPPFLFGWVQLVAIEGLAGLEKLQYLLALVHLLPATEEVLGLHPLLFWLFEENSSFFCLFLSSLEGDSIQLGDQVGILFLALLVTGPQR